MQVLAPILLSPHDPDTVYFGAQSLFRSKDRGDTWEKLTADQSYNDKAKLGDIPDQLIITISESPKRKGLVYTGTDDGRLWYSTNLGGKWTEASDPNLPGYWISRVAIDPIDAAVAYVTYSGYRAGVDTADVRRTGDGGAPGAEIRRTHPAATAGYEASEHLGQLDRVAVGCLFYDAYPARVAARIQ